jgi:hypothetical protein
MGQFVRGKFDIGPYPPNINNSLTLDNDQLNAQIFNTFVIIRYMYMFRAISC